MKVYRSIEQIPVFKNAVITIGTFDGVHQGHQKIITALKKEAVNVKGETVIITFHPHPRKIVKPGETLGLINTLDEKIELLRAAGIHHLVVVPFTESFAELGAEAYVSEFLIAKFRPASIIIGYDHRFGKGRTGDYKMLEEKSVQYGYRLVEIPQHVLDEVSISSTKIRNALLQSDIETANRLLGYPYFFEGTVVKGDQLGRTLGYPTANLEFTDLDKIHLGHGVYAVHIEIGGQLRKGMMSIGTRPTLVNSDEKVEVNIFDFDEMIYGKILRVYVYHFLRQQEKYPSLEVMIEQLHKDKQKSLELLQG